MPWNQSVTFRVRGNYCSWPAAPDHRHAALRLATVENIKVSGTVVETDS